MAFDWTAVADAIKGAVTSNLGGVVTITRRERGRYTPTPDDVYHRGPHELGTNADFYGVLASDKANLSVLGAGTSVEQSTRKVLVSPGAFEPEPGDWLEFGDLEGEITTVKTERPDGTTPVIHACGVRV